MINWFYLFFLFFALKEFYFDMILVLKIFVLMTIVSFIVYHLGKGPLAIVLILGVSWFVLFDAFWFFGGVYVLMMLLMLGASGILIDFFFVSGGMGGGEQQSPVSSGADLMKRKAMMMRGQNIAHGLVRRFRGR